MYNQKKKRKPIYDVDSGVPPTEEQLAKMRKQAQNVIWYWLNQSDQTRKKMFDKLVDGKGMPEDFANTILDEFEEQGYLNDKRYAENFVNSKMTYEKLGLFAIKQKLMLKGVPRDIIDQVTAEVEPEDLEEGAYELARKRINSTRNLEPQKRLQTIASYLVRRGHNGSLAFKAAKQAIQEAEDTNELDDQDYPDN